MSLIINKGIMTKLLQKHNVTFEEILECFSNREKGFLEDEREQNKTIPPTQWFIAKTDSRRLLKVVFITFSNGDTHIKTAYEPNDKEVKIYEKYA